MVTAGKGSPGVTTTAVALAAVWPRPVLLAECDPAGGDLPALLPGGGGAVLTATRGVVSLAAAARTQPHPSLDDHVQLVAGGLPVLAGPASAAQAAALSQSWPAVIDTLAGLEDVDVIVDCGRYSADDATRRLIAAADLTARGVPGVGDVGRARPRGARGARSPRRRQPASGRASRRGRDRRSGRGSRGRGCARRAHAGVRHRARRTTRRPREGLCGAWSRTAGSQSTGGWRTGARSPG